MTRDKASKAGYAMPSAWLAILSLLILTMGIGCSKKSAGDGELSVEAPLSETRALVNEHVPDPETRNQLLAILDREEARLLDLYALERAQLETLRVLHTRYDASRADFERVMQAYNDEAREVTKELLSSRDEVMALVTPEQWEKISKGKIDH